MLPSRAYFTNEHIRVSGETMKAEHERKRAIELKRGLLLIHHFAACGFVDVFKKAAIARNAKGVLRRMFIPLWRKKRGMLPPCLTLAKQVSSGEQPTGDYAHALFTKHQVLACLPNDDIQKLVQTMMTVSVNRNSESRTLIRKGTSSDFAYFITSGSVTRSDGVVYEPKEWVGQQACDHYDNFISDYSYSVSDNFEGLALEIRRIKLIISPDSRERVLHQLSRSRRQEYMYNKGIQPYELGLYKFFKNWDDSMLLRISASFEPVALTALDYVYKQGDPAKYLYLLESGEATSFQHIMKSHSVLHSYAPRDTLATEDIILGCAHSTTVQVNQDSNLWRISSDVVLPMLASDNYNFARRLKHELAFRVTRRSGVQNRVPIQVLQKCNSYVDWPRQLLQELQKEFKPVVYCEGDVIAGKREESHATFVVTHGEAVASVGDSMGRYGSQIRVGDGVGFWECLLGVSYRETIQTKTVLEGYAIGAAAIRSACASCYPLPLEWSRRMQSAAINWCHLYGESVLADRINLMKNNDFLGQFLTPPGFIQKKSAKIRDSQKISVAEAKDIAEREALLEKMKEHLSNSPLGRLDLDAVRREMMTQVKEVRRAPRVSPLPRSPNPLDESKVGKGVEEGLFSPSESKGGPVRLTKIPSPPKLTKASHADMITVREVMNKWSVTARVPEPPPSPPPYTPISRRLAKEVPRLTPTKKILPQIHLKNATQYTPKVPTSLSHLLRPRARPLHLTSSLRPSNSYHSSNHLKPIL
eukprot:TRINITY_DN8269_c1_g1_i1.p1 TRINITY_DN8269_c1_g1~~TRINITY_DN8269_c1_g1_i1.p1  ORF type:complete len:780 (+),score=115.68 TRINITY_DN8269_c1_g1_i1:70-2340(+)